MRTTILPINHQSLVKIAMSAVQLAPKIPMAAARLIPLVILREQSTEKQNYQFLQFVVIPLLVLKKVIDISSVKNSNLLKQA